MRRSLSGPIRISTLSVRQASGHGVMPQVTTDCAVRRPNVSPPGGGGTAAAVLQEHGAEKPPDIMVQLMALALDPKVLIADRERIERVLPVLDELRAGAPLHLMTVRYDGELPDDADRLRAELVSARDRGVDVVFTRKVLFV